MIPELNKFLRVMASVRQLVSQLNLLLTIDIMK